MAEVDLIIKTQVFVKEKTNRSMEQNKDLRYIFL